MADQAVPTVDLPDEYTEEWGDQFLRRTYEQAGRHTSRVLYDIAAELKKRPTLRKELRRAAEVIDAVHVGARWGFDQIKAGKLTEDEVIQELVYGRLEPTDVGAAAVIAEIVWERERLDSMWVRIEEVDSAAGGPQAGAADNLVEGWKDATLQLHRSVFDAIKAGRVDAREAITILTGQKAIDLNHTEYPWLIPAAPDGVGGGDETLRSVLAGISDDIRARAANLPDDSEWSAPLAHLADRLAQGAAFGEATDA
jgi:hypothetical protein